MTTAENVIQALKLYGKESWQYAKAVREHIRADTYR